MLLLLDASALLNDFGFEFKKNESYSTTNLVFSEFRDFRSRNLAEHALQKGILKICDPSFPSVRRAHSIANSCEVKSLSDADISIFALALEFKGKQKFVLVTDDYPVQFLCKRAGIPFESVIRGKTKKKSRKPKKTVSSFLKKSSKPPKKTSK